ncbi:MAG: MYXO-CTERM sorting domain-containing protein, partial [bacterium]
GTTYYYCAIAQNASGVSFGALLTFTTPGAPSVTTAAATLVMSASATLNATANPNLDTATGWFRYDTTDPGTCDDTFGIRVPSSGGTSLGSGSSVVAFSEALTGLAPSTTYYYCGIAQNASGTTVGAVLMFTTTAAPIVTTEDATDLTSTTATLQGTVNPNLAATTAWFRYDTTDPGACDDSFGTRAPATGGTDAGAGSAVVAFSEAITGLAPGATYYYCAIAESAEGISFGAVLTLTAAADLPDVTTNPPTSVLSDSAELNGAANPNGDATTGWFRYDTTDPGACDDTFGTRVPATGGSALGGGVSSVAFSEAIASLNPGATYYYCAIGANSHGTDYGEVLTFVTGLAPPTVTTEDATDILANSVNLVGTANPNGTATTSWFRLGDFDPGTCDDAFGARVPETGGTAVGDGYAPVVFSELLVGLEPASTHYYCAAASNQAGATFGEVRSVTTAAVAPEVETRTAVVDGQNVDLNGEANPLGAETTAWFRYDTVTPTACNDTFGTRVPASDGQSVGAGRAAVAFTESLAGLEPGTYYYCAIASNSGGTGYGEVRTFAIPPLPEAPSSACSCRASGRQSGAEALLLFLLVLAFVRLRRRRRR